MNQHEIIVGNIGTVYSGRDRNEAAKRYSIYVSMSQSGYGRAANETVTWMRDGEVYQETEQ